MNNPNNKYIVILWGIAILVIIGAVAYTLLEALKTIAPIIASIIAGSFAIAGAVLKYALEVEKSAEIKRMELMQENYKNILNKIAQYIKSKGTDADALSSAHLESWVVGSPEVIKLTQNFMDKRSNLRLKSLLQQMRKDIGLTDKDLQKLQLLAFTREQGGVLEEESKGNEINIG